MINEDVLHVINMYTKYAHDVSIDKQFILDELKELFFEENSDYIIQNIDYFFDYINTPRQSLWNSSKTQENANDRINILLNKEQPDQRTDEWYKYRYNMLTASSLWKIFKSDSSRRELIESKKKPLDLQKYKSVNTESTLHWGHKYEPLSVLFYEDMFNTTVGDFGCIKHSQYDFIGASPDGINIKKEHPLHGRMLEIKNIVNRTIDGIPKYEYWIQMQLQMEVCDLDYCDFLECKFIEYNSYQDYVSDGSSFNHTRNNMIKGVIVQLFNGIEPLYFYPPLNISQSEFELWKTKVIEENTNCSWIQDIYWHLDEYSCILVERNKEWFTQSINDIRDIWLKII
jgi:putative phage-type endonuclease